MVRRIAVRLANAVVLIVAVVVLSYLLLYLAPGGPIAAIEGASGAALSPQMQAQLTHQFGLDRPWYVQAATWFVQVLQGNFGVSFYYSRPVTELVLGALSNTIVLALTAFVLSSVMGTVAGVIAAQKPRGAVSRGVTILAIAGYSAPPFWIAIILLVVFASAIRVFPVSGMASAIPPTGFLNQLGDLAAHLTLPAVTLTLAWVGTYARTARASMIEVMQSDYIRTAYAKGASYLSVVFRHALRNALLPVLTLAGMQVGTMVSGAILVETVFSWPGIGPLALQGVSSRDTPLLVGIFVISSVAVIVANFVTDALYSVVDPRIRVGATSSR